MSSSNCCFLTYIQISQEAGQVVWYSHLFKNFPQFVMIHTIKVWTITNNAMGIIVHFFQGTPVYASKWKGWTTGDVYVQSQFSKLFYHPVFPNTMCKHSSCFIPFTLLSVVSLFSFSHPTEHLMVIFVILICSSLMTTDVQHFFVSILATCMWFTSFCLLKRGSFYSTLQVHLSH